MWVLQFNFLLSFRLALLQLWGMLSISCMRGEVWVCLFYFFFSFLLLKGPEDNLPLAVGFLCIGCVGNLFLRCQTGHFLRAAIIIGTPGLVNWGACGQGWSSCSYRICPQGGSTFSWDPLVPGGKQSLRAGYLPGLWNWPEQTGKGLSLTSFST